MVCIEEPVLDGGPGERNIGREKEKNHPCVSLTLNEPRACAALCHPVHQVLVSAIPQYLCPVVVHLAFARGDDNRARPAGPLLEWKEEGGSHWRGHGTRLICSLSPFDPTAIFYGDGPAFKSTAVDTRLQCHEQLQVF